MLYNAGLEPIESMLVKKVGSLSLGCSPFLFFLYFFVQNYMLHMRFFFVKYIGVLLCIGIGIILFQK